MYIIDCADALDYIVQYIDVYVILVFMDVTECNVNNTVR